MTVTKQETRRTDLNAILQAEQHRRGGLWRFLQQGFWGLLVVALLVASIRTAEVSPRQFWKGLPRLGELLVRFWPLTFPNYRLSWLRLGKH